MYPGSSRQTASRLCSLSRTAQSATTSSSANISTDGHSSCYPSPQGSPVPHQQHISHTAIIREPFRSTGLKMMFMTFAGTGPPEWDQRNTFKVMLVCGLAMACVPLNCWDGAIARITLEFDNIDNRPGFLHHDIDWPDIDTFASGCPTLVTFTVRLLLAKPQVAELAHGLVTRLKRIFEEGKLVVTFAGSDNEDSCVWSFEQPLRRMTMYRGRSGNYSVALHLDCNIR